MTNFKHPLLSAISNHYIMLLVCYMSRPTVSHLCGGSKNELNKNPDTRVNDLLDLNDTHL